MVLRISTGCRAMLRVMHSRLLGIIVVVASVAVLAGQSKPPSDIHPESLSRLPPLQRDEPGRRGQARVGRPRRRRPRHAASPDRRPYRSTARARPNRSSSLNQLPAQDGRRQSGYFELSALIAAREFDQQYEWSGHEPAALRAGVEQSVIDVIKFNKDVNGLSEKDATVIRLGRALLRDHKVSSELWAKTVELFGRQGAIEIVAIDRRLRDGWPDADRR